MPVTDVLYQDKDLVVCRKAPGLLSEGEGPDSLVTLLSRQCGGPVYPVHRLDRGAAGLMVFARSQASAAARSRAVQEKRLNKEYFALVSGAPTPAVQDLATGKQVDLVSLDAEHVASLIKTSPYYKEYTIAKDVYNTPEDVTTVAVAAVVIARDDVSEAAVYNFVSSIFEDIDSIGHAKKAELDLDFAASITDVPYHPGAAKYFAEKDIEVATKQF